MPVGRTVSDTLYLAPGVSSSRHGRPANPSIAGGSGLDNQYVVDGVNVTNQGYGALGSYSIVFGSLGNATPFDFIQEVQVKTGGYEAEYGQATGGVVNVDDQERIERRSRLGLRLHAARRARGELEAISRRTNGSVQTESTTTLSTAASRAAVPIVRNKLFFFGAIDPGRGRRTLHAPDGLPARRASATSIASATP